MGQILGFRKISETHMQGYQTFVNWQKFRKMEKFFPSKTFRQTSVYSAIDNRTQCILRSAAEQLFY